MVEFSGLVSLGGTTLGCEGSPEGLNEGSIC